MSKIVVTFDTTEKTLDVTMGGKTVENVGGVYIGQSWRDPDDFCCEISMSEKNDDEGVTTLTRLIASETKAAQEAVAKATATESNIDGFVIEQVKKSNKTAQAETVQPGKARADILAYFGVKE